MLQPLRPAEDKDIRHLRTWANPTLPAPSILIMDGSPLVDLTWYEGEEGHGFQFLINLCKPHCNGNQGIPFLANISLVDEFVYAHREENTPETIIQSHMILSQMRAKHENRV
jgi:hypothetical protein